MYRVHGLNTGALFLKRGRVFVWVEIIGGVS
jgi:hypothetical protein